MKYLLLHKQIVSWEIYTDDTNDILDRTQKKNCVKSSLRTNLSETLLCATNNSKKKMDQQNFIQAQNILA